MDSILAEPAAVTGQRGHHEIATALTTLVTLIRNGANVVIHCSAGIHRTGMFTYALLRAWDLDTDEAMSALTRLRTATAEGVGAQRLTWAEDLATTVRHRLNSTPKSARPDSVTSAPQQADPS